MSLTVWEVKKLMDGLKKQFQADSFCAREIGVTVDQLKRQILRYAANEQQTLSELSSLLELEGCCCNPFEAYECGKRDQEAGLTQSAGILSYFHEVNSRRDVQQVAWAIQERYERLCLCLDSRRFLVDDLVANLRKLYGGLNQNADYYYRCGYQANLRE